MNLSQETIDKKFSLPKTTNINNTTRKTIGCFTETIGFLYQQTTIKLNLKSQGQRDFTQMFILVHSKSRATSSLLRTLRKSTKQSQLDHLHNNQQNDLEHLKKHTFLGQHTNTKIDDLDPLKNTQPISAHTETKLVFTEHKDYTCYRR